MTNYFHLFRNKQYHAVLSDGKMGAKKCFTGNIFPVALFWIWNVSQICLVENITASQAARIQTFPCIPEEGLRVPVSKFKPPTVTADQSLKGQCELLEPGRERIQQAEGGTSLQEVVCYSPRVGLAETNFLGQLLTTKVQKLLDGTSITLRLSCLWMYIHSGALGLGTW